MYATCINSSYMLSSVQKIISYTLKVLIRDHFFLSNHTFLINSIRRNVRMGFLSELIGINRIS